MTAREALVDLAERVPDEDVPLVRSLLARFVPGLTVAEMRSIADAATPDNEPLSEGEEQGFAEAEEYLAGRARGIPHQEVVGRSDRDA